MVNNGYMGVVYLIDDISQLSNPIDDINPIDDWES